MASGHVNRANRPNTRLHRPTLLREESSCQLGAVHTRGIADLNFRSTVAKCQEQTSHLSASARAEIGMSVDSKCYQRAAGTGLNAGKVRMCSSTPAPLGKLARRFS